MPSYMRPDLSLVRLDTLLGHRTAGYHATKELIATSAGKFTAIYAANDLIAMGALLALHEAGIKVPEEISVVGFDNMPEGRFFHPPLTTAT